ncbi:hypothetical protein L6164_031893 [Bauhinia variegata]|uniref:Uncharacterized protein n=1 Tax=Bauhinia variegata TaxID=167791 RepID=A0ACB9KM21_BAUVA|nr:hypothetical protein L6164_031893 [Bauhinia variegata]
MDSFNFGNLQEEKANAILKYRQLRKFASLFRFIELCVVLVLISRLSIQLPVAVRSSGDYFRNLSVLVISPRFVFVVGNVIIITLFAQSGHFSAQGSPSKSSESDFYEEFIQKSTKHQKIGKQIKYPEKHCIAAEDSMKNQIVGGEKIKYTEKHCMRTGPASIRNKGIDEHKIKHSKSKRIGTGYSIKNHSADELEKQCIRTEPKRQSIRTGHSIRDHRADGYPEKHSIRTENSIKNKRVGGYQIKWQEDQGEKSENVNICMELKDYRRSLTEKFSPANTEKQQHVLQRSQTEKSCKSIEAAEEVARISYPEDEMSNDEFRRTVEAFIARQQRLRREEESCIV